MAANGRNIVLCLGGQLAGAEVVVSSASSEISLVPSTDQSFDRRVQDLWPSRASAVLALKPCLVILSNRSDMSLVAYTVMFKFIDAHGRAQVTYLQSKAPEAVASDGHSPFARGVDIPSGADAVIGTAFDGEPPRDELLRLYAEPYEERSSTARTIEVSLEAALFADGTLVGSDITGLAKAFSTYLDAHQTLYRAVLRDLGAGKTVDATFAGVMSVFDSSPPHPTDQVAIYTNVAAQDALLWRTRYGDDSIPGILRRAIRAFPFGIKRVTKK